MIMLLAALLAAGPEGASKAAGTPPVEASPREIADNPRPQQPPGQTLPMTPARRLRFETTRGTWMSLDIAPDGKRIVFDLLGDLYAMPAAGGRATRLTSGMAFDTQPAVSPDGRSIVFVSDRSGADNLWIIGADGKGARQLSFGDDDTVLASPAWSADGKAIFVSRYRPDLNAYELWRYDLAGGETLIVPIRDSRDSPRSAWRSSLGAVASPDGRSLYFARRTGDLAHDEVDEWTIVQRDLRDGSERAIVREPDGPRRAGNPGAAFRPALSPDGRLLAYASRIDGQTELRLRDLATGVDRRIAFPIARDQLQASMWQDIVSRYAFTADGKAILLNVNGEIRRVATDSGAVTPVPFAAAVDIGIGPSTRQDIREETGPVRARLITAPIASPDGKTLAFSALGRLYLMPLDGRSLPKPFAPGGDPAFQPSWSPDGKRLVWVSWTERAGGHVWTAPIDGSAPPLRLSDPPAYYSYPVFTPDGARILVLRTAQQERLNLYMEYGRLRDADLVALPAAGGLGRLLFRGDIGARPQFTRKPGVAYVLADDGLNEVDLATGKRTLAVQVKGPGWYFQDGAVAVDDLRISPDGKWVLAQVAQQLHVVAMPAISGQTIDLSDPHLPHRRVSEGGADYFEWSADGRTIGWSTGSTWHERPLAEVRLLPAATPGWSADRASPKDRSFGAVVELPRDVPTGRMLLRGARVLTMAPGDRVIEQGDILIDGDRITAVGPTGSIAVPPGTAIRDATGKTIVPGFVDTHDHIATIRRDVLGFEEWGFRARLAWGVTTSFDPSTLTIDMLPYEDALDAGLMFGPRLHQTGVALFSMQRFSSLDDAIAVIRRYRDDYRLRNIKEYRTGSREVRQWVAEACRILGMQPTTEGALSMKLDLSQIIDGFAGNEHALVATPLQDDVLQLMRFAHTSYTTTLEIGNGGPPGQDWSIEQDDPHDDAKLRHYWPHAAIDQMMLRRPWRRLQEYRFPSIAADAGAVQAAGGLVGIGSHGETPGIGFHYEMEAHAQGGMTPMAILHAATIGSAETIGRKSDLGSIEPGKLADLVILDKDPRQDIHDARAIAQVMRGGRLYDAATLAQIAPTPTPAPPPAWFAQPGAAARWLSEGDFREAARP